MHELCVNFLSIIGYNDSEEINVFILTNRKVKIRRFRCTGTSSMILVSNIFVDVCTFTRC